MKCPFCQQELRSVIQQEGENTHTTWHCPKCELGKYKWACGNKTLWQALIDTRKALDAALDKLKRIQKIYTNAPFNTPINYANVCTDMYDVATEQIKESDNE